MKPRTTPAGNGAPTIPIRYLTLKAYVKETKRTQADIARALGFGASTFSQYVNQVRSPNLKNALRLHELGIPLESLLRPRRKRRPPPRRVVPKRQRSAT